MKVCRGHFPISREAFCEGMQGSFPYLPGSLRLKVCRGHFPISREALVERGGGGGGGGVRANAELAFPFFPFRFCHLLLPDMVLSFSPLSFLSLALLRKPSWLPTESWRRRSLPTLSKLSVRTWDPQCRTESSTRSTLNLAFKLHWVARTDCARAQRRTK